MYSLPTRCIAMARPVNRFKVYGVTPPVQCKGAQKRGHIALEGDDRDAVNELLQLYTDVGDRGIQRHQVFLPVSTLVHIEECVKKPLSRLLEKKDVLDLGDSENIRDWLQVSGASTITRAFYTLTALQNGRDDPRRGDNQKYDINPLCDLLKQAADSFYATYTRSAMRIGVHRPAMRINNV